MFFDENLLTDKTSPLGIAWLLATLGPRNQARKISRKELIQYDLVEACAYISEPSEPLALRTSATLLYGVTKVYMQHYEDFYSAVNTFHQTLRRTIITDFSTTINGGTGGTRGIDMADEGKSKLDQITFAGIDIGWQSGLDINFSLIDWCNPLGNARKRRASSKLDSQLSQQSQQEEDGEDESSESEGEDGVMRKRLRNSSTPGAHDPTLRVKTSLHHASDRISNPDDPMFEPFTGGGLDLGLELDLPGDHPDTSFSAPGEAFNDAMGGDEQLFDDGGDKLDGGTLLLDRTTREGTHVSLDSNGNPKPTQLRSPFKKKARISATSIDEVEELVNEGRKKAKKIRTVKWDEALELPQTTDADARNHYRRVMNEERLSVEGKNRERDVQLRADAMVDGICGWLDSFDVGMRDLLCEAAKLGKWKWELDVANHRLGGNITNEDGDEERSALVDGDGGLAFDGGDGMMSNGMDTTTFESGYQDVFTDFVQPVHDPESAPAARARRSESTDVEAGRRGSQASQVVLPWDSKKRSSNAGDDHFEGPDDSFSPGSLHLTAMTPQEARKSGHTGSQDFAGLLNRRGNRSRSGSVLQERAGQPAAMLLGPEGDDDSLPQSMRDLADEPSQNKEVPKQFRPEQLALIEKDPRNFMQYLEKEMIKKSTDEVEFDALMDEMQSKHVAALAFYNCLNKLKAHPAALATKGLLRVHQPVAFENISIQFTAAVA